MLHLSKWVYLRYSLLSLSRLKALGSSHSWSCPSCCVPAAPGGPTPTNTVSFSLGFSSLHTSTVQPGSSSPSLQTSYPSHSSCFWLFPDPFRVFQWKPKDLLDRGVKLLHFMSFNPVDLVYIQESNLNSFSSFRIPGCSTLRSDRTHSRSGILSPDDLLDSGDVIIFVR